MARKFNELREKMSPERRTKSTLMAQEMMAEMLLGEIRKQTGLTQVDLAERLGITQPTLSKLESQDDMQLSTLRRIIEALGGDLEVIARLPGDKTVKLGQFHAHAQMA